MTRPFKLLAIAAAALIGCGSALAQGTNQGSSPATVLKGGTGASTAAGARTNLGVAIGSNVEAWDADLDALAALSGTNTIYYRSGASAWSAVSIGGLLSFAGGTLNVGDAELVALAGLTSAADKCSYFTGSGTAALMDCPSWSRAVTSAASASAGRTAFGLAIGTDVQAFDAELAALAGLTSANNKCFYWTGTATAATFDCSSLGRSVANVADAAALRTLAGAVIGTNVQAWDADLDALAALAGTNTIYYRSAANTWTAVSIGSLLSFSAGTLNVGDAELVALAGLTSSADKCAYFTGSGTAALMDCLSWSRSVTSAATAAAGRTAFGLAIGSDVQAYNVNLAAYAGLTGAAGKIGYFTAAGTMALFDSTTFGRSVSNVADAAALRTLAGAVIGTNVQAWDADIDALAANSANGLWARTGAGTGAARTATGTANEVCITNGDGVSGNPTFGICAGWLATARTYSATQTFAGLISTGMQDNQGTLKLSSFVTSTQLTANANDYTATDGSNTCTAKTSLRISTNASRNITGLSCGQAEGDLRIVHNVGSNPAVLLNQDASSTAANRFLFGGDMTLAADTSVTLRYDGVASRWRAITSPGAGGGGGGVTSVTIAAGQGVRVDGTCTITGSGTCTVTPIVRSYLSGLTLSAAGSTSTFGVAAGIAADSTAADTMTLASAYTKTTSSWAVGTATGSLDTGTIANSTWYHVHQIKRPDTGVVDVLVSLSATAPTLPTNYTLFRRIGSMKTDGSGNWFAFLQVGDQFIWAVPTADQSAASISSTSALYSVNVPPGVSVDITGRVTFAPGASSFLLVQSPLTATQTANSPGGNYDISSSATVNGVGVVSAKTNTSQQIRAVSSTGAAAALYWLTTGWTDRRGRDN